MIRAQAGALKGAPVDQIVRVSVHLHDLSATTADVYQVEEKKKKAEAEVV
jgi:hypothetical protein